MIVCGIDPGYQNAAVAFVGDCEPQVYDVPHRVITRNGKETREVDYAALRDLIRSHGPDVGVIEKVSGRPHDSPIGSFWFGYAAATCRCALVESCGEVVETAPGAWKRIAMIFKHAKDESVSMAVDRYPSLRARLIEEPTGRKRKRVLHVDRADAVLIAASVLDGIGK